LSGEKSGALSFDFTAETDDSKAVYSVFAEPFTLSGSGEISLSVFTENDYPHEIRALLEDSSGKESRIILGENLEGGTWHTLKGKIPEDASSPVILKRIYALYQTDEEKDLGTLYFDNLVYSYTAPYTYPYKSGNVYDDFAEGEGEGMLIRAGALSAAEKTLISHYTDVEMEKVTSDSDYGILLGSRNTFSSTEKDNALFITLNTKSGGIRKTSSSQWTSLKKAIDSSKKDFIFIVSDNSIFGNDSFENKVIEDFLASTDKTITVITKGESDSLSIINGVRYFTLAPIDNDFDLSSRVEKIHYLEFHLDDTLSYIWKPLID
ncbi:MAG: hypothetical protein Q4G23_12460, partial [Clostridia bacterium]|nr:hypothetical protein [Clostridia bacterium]